MATLSSRGFDVWGQMDYPVEFIHALGCYALMAWPQDPGRILGKFLKKY
jgi:L-asparaginase